MMRTREELHEILCDILGSRNCYFSPPSNIRMKYPCIVYDSDGESVQHADDKRYLHRKRYSILVIDQRPNSWIHERILDQMMYCGFDREYIADGMYHYALSLYF